MVRTLLLVITWCSLWINAHAQWNTAGAVAQSIQSTEVVTADWYVSPNGNGTTGDSPENALNDITDLNAQTLSPGDVVAFEAGYTYYGNLTINDSGTEGNPIVFKAYGTGSKPEITGLYTVPSWDVAANIHTSSAAVSTLSSCNVVLIDGVITSKGKTPNTGFFTIDSHVGHASLTSADLSGVTVNTNMEVLTKPDRWYLNVSGISSVSSNTIYTTLSQSKDHHDNWGFWLQNDVACLDLNNENSYDSSTKKLSVYHSSTPGTVQVSSLTNLVTIDAQSYITFEGLRFTGADSAAFFLKNAKYISVLNCEIMYCFDGVRGQKPNNTTGNPLDSRNLTIKRTTLKNLLNCGVWLDEDFGNATLDSLVMDSIGMWHGMGGSGDGTYSAVRVMGDSLTLTYSSITHTGYNPVSLDGVGSYIYRNYIDGYNSVKDDGAGLYLARQNTGRILSENIVKNGHGTTFFLPSTSYDDPWEVLRAKGIYFDDDAQYVTATYNTVFNVVDNGLFLHGNHGDHTIDYNLLANCRGWNGLFSIAQDDPTADMSNVSFQHNILVAYADGQRVASAITDPALTLTGYGTFDYNYYVSPLDNEALMNYDTDMTSGGSTDTNLAGWRTALGVDANSTDPAISVADTSEIFFTDNWSHTVKVATLPAGTWQEVDGTTHTGTVNVQPFRGIVLFKQ